MRTHHAEPSISAFTMWLACGGIDIHARPSGPKQPQKCGGLTNTIGIKRVKLKDSLDSLLG